MRRSDARGGRTRRARSSATAVPKVSRAERGRAIDRGSRDCCSRPLRELTRSPIGQLQTAAGSYAPIGHWTAVARDRQGRVRRADAAARNPTNYPEALRLSLLRELAKPRLYLHRLPPFGSAWLDRSRAARQSGAFQACKEPSDRGQTDRQEAGLSAALAELTRRLSRCFRVGRDRPGVFAPRPHLLDDRRCFVCREVVDWRKPIHRGGV